MRALTISTADVARCPDLSIDPEHWEVDETGLVWCAHERASYERWCFESAADHGEFLPMPIDRLHPANRCDACGGPPTAENPCTMYRGDGPDLENGPSPNDLPYTLHDYDCEGDHDAVDDR